MADETSRKTRRIPYRSLCRLNSRLESAESIEGVFLILKNFFSRWFPTVELKFARYGEWLSIDGRKIVVRGRAWSSVWEDISRVIDELENIPICPHCKARLTVVSETSWTTYVWNYRHQAYEAEERWDESEIRCGNCSADVSELFPDGVCNF